jgi:gliding motility-associated-like protein
MNKTIVTLLALCAVLCCTAFQSPFSPPEFACKVYLPNAFSPNEDGVNDVFQAHVGCTVTEFDLRVFNRWGQLIFATQQPDEGWDGTTKGQPAIQAVYVYVLKVTYDQDGEARQEVQTGDVALIR